MPSNVKCKDCSLKEGNILDKRKPQCYRKLAFEDEDQIHDCGMFMEKKE